MPEIPEEIFIEGLRQLIELDKNWIPEKENHSLYIRPLMFASDVAIGVRPSDTYKFIVILSPTGPYYAEPMKIAVEEKYTRAAPGGVGFSKNAGNYGGVCWRLLLQSRMVTTRYCGLTLLNINGCRK